MKNSKLIIASLILFLIVNTNYFWLGSLGFWALIVGVVVLLIAVIIAICITYEIGKYLLSRERKVANNLYIAVVILGLLVYRPMGMIEFEQFESADVLVASREGSANCKVIVKLKDDNTFTEKKVCFGLDRIKGQYSVNHDTIRVSEVTSGNKKESFEFAIVKIVKDKYESEQLLLYKDLNDTEPLVLYIEKNTLIK